MDKRAFKQRMQSLKTYREQNPGKSYLDFKSYQDGGETKSSTPVFDSLNKEQTDRLYDDDALIDKSTLARALAKDDIFNKSAKEYIEKNLTADSGSMSLYAGELPEVDVKAPEILYAYLNTYYPVTSRYKYSGHSLLITPGGKDIDYLSSDKGYNLVTNNCADQTMQALEQVFNKSSNTKLFTTPGDVVDFAKENRASKVPTDKYEMDFDYDSGYMVPYSSEEYASTKGMIQHRIPLNIEQARKLESITVKQNKLTKYADGGETPKKKLTTPPPYDNNYSGVRVSPYNGQPIPNGSLKSAFDLEDGANLTPLGDAITIKDMGSAISNKDWEGLGWASLGLIPFVPSTIRGLKTPKVRGTFSHTIPKVNNQITLKQIEQIMEKRSVESLRFADDFYLKDETDAINARNLMIEALSKDKKYYKRAAEVDAINGTNYVGTYKSLQKEYTKSPKLLPDVKMDSKMGIDNDGRIDLSEEAEFDLATGDGKPKPSDFTISLNPNGRASKDVLDHEMSHLTDMVQSTNSVKANPLGAPYWDNQLINGSRHNDTFKDYDTYLKDNTDAPLSESRYNYLTKGTEEKAFVNTMRTDMAHRNIIKKRTQDPTKKQLAEYLKIPDIDQSIAKLSKLYKSADGLYKATKTMPYLATAGLTAYAAMKMQKDSYTQNEPYNKTN